MNEKLSDIIDAPIDDIVVVPQESTKEPQSTEMVTHEEIAQTFEDSMEKDLESDYKKVRKNLRNMINECQTVLSNLVSLAENTEAPRSYEVLADMMRTASQLGKDLIELHHRTRTIREVGSSINIKNETNNAIYIGSTKELQDLINPKRNNIKVLTAEVHNAENEEEITE